MKRHTLFITAIIILFCASIFAADSAVDKGSKIIGASGYLIYQNGDLYERGGKSVLTVAAAPNLLFFISKGVYLGPEILFYNHSKYNFEESQLGFGPRLGFILNPSAADDNARAYSLFYFSLFTTWTRVTVNETRLGRSYDGSYQTYEIETKSNNFSYGIQLGSYNMIHSHFAIDANIRLSFDKNSRVNSSFEETGYTIMFGVGIVGFSF